MYQAQSDKLNELTIISRIKIPNHNNDLKIQLYLLIEVLYGDIQ